MSGVDVRFVDVGQGASTVVVERVDGTNRATLIDCGPVGQKAVLSVLRDSKVSYIDRIVLSHNDRDHWGGLRKIASDFRGRIGKIYYVTDRNLSECEAFGVVRSCMERGWLRDPPVRISIEGGPIAAKSGDSCFRLIFLGPSGYESDLASVDDKHNDASAVVIVRVGAQQVMICGDATVTTIRNIQSRRKVPIECFAVAVPHHGGKLFGVADQRWFYKEVCKTRVAIVSVGSINSYGHPDEEVIRAIADSGASVMCTQLTEKCMPKSVSRGCGDKGAISCAGTIHITIPERGSANVRGRSRHSQFVQRLRRECGGCPLCDVGESL